MLSLDVDKEIALVEMEYNEKNHSRECGMFG